jgi:glycosyltransferase involved in cell wall biosynthesis
MRNVIVISYFFPPCNLTASQRVYSWAKYLHLFGIYPTIVTRRWDHEITKLSDVSKSTLNEVLYEKNDNYEVYYLPYRANLRDRLYTKSEIKNKLMRRFLSLVEVFFQLWTNRVIPYKNLYTFSKDLIAKHPTKFELLLISGNPFIQFKFGYFLSKKYNIPWIADYRDAWTTSEINFINKNKMFVLLNYFERYFEKKWISSSSLVTASTNEIAKRIENFVLVPSDSLFNGYDHEEMDGILVTNKFEDFTITYVGTLYDGQRIELFCEVFKKIIDSGAVNKIHFLLPGLKFYEKQDRRLKNLLSGYEKYFTTTPRIPRNQVLEIEKKSHLLLHVAWEKHDGIVASKIYEYIGSGSSILVCPSDKGAIEAIVSDSKCGECLNTVEEIETFILKKYFEFENGTVENSASNSFAFSRYIQVEKLVSMIDSIQVVK